MKYMFTILSICLTLSFASTLTGQRFACDGQLLIATNDGFKTSISRPIYIPFSTPFLSPLAVYQNASFDAVGFNPVDNYLYAVLKHTNELVRLKRNSTYEIVGAASIADTLKTHAGDCTADGRYLCHDYKLNQILVFDVVDNFDLLNRIDLFWDPESDINEDFNVRFYDFAIDPNNPTVAYAYQSAASIDNLEPEATQGFLLQINLDFDDSNLGMVTPIALVDPNKVSHLGGLLFSPDSQLIGYGSSDPSINPTQKRFYSINTFNGTVSDLIIANQGATLSDGCSCPYSFNFSCQVPTEGMFCNDDTKNFFLRINNNSFNPIENITLRDTFPEGMIIKEIIGPFDGNLNEGIGSRILEITELNIPPKSIVEIKIRVQSIDAKVGETYNQAFLYNLPARFDGVVASDQLATPAIVGDASLFYVTPRRLDNVTWEVTQPTDCLLANDGQIVVTSPQFFPNQGYDIRIRNKIGWEEYTSQVTIDQNNSFLLDSLTPGDYQLREVRSLSDNCSLAVQDTSMLLEAPNELLDLVVNSNSPICEGEKLILNSEVSPDGIVRWTGPNLFGYDDFNPIIENAATEYTGEYKIVAKYGYCEKTEYLDAAIKPQVNASILGQSTYCQRDQIALAINTTNENLTYSWSGPNDLSRTDSTVIIASISDEQEGMYAVTVSNGGCSDTANLYITVLPTPTITLQDELITNFCLDVILSPLILASNDLSYTWSPQIGLSCTDCPNPTVEAIVQPSYELIIENEYSCRDSASIEIILDKTKIAYAPNVFRLHAEVENDRFTLYPSCIVHQIRRLQIFDRWGNVVFSSVTNTPNQNIKPWNGYIGSNVANSGVYSWTAEVELIDGSIESLSGTVTFL